MIDRIGQQLGNYRLVRLLGQGGFADVYLGEHVYLKTQAAIKVLHAQITTDEMGSFITEAQNIASLRHPHIIRVLDFGVQNNTPFLVMDYAPQGTLRQLHPKGAQVPLALIVFYVKQIAAALQYAHEHKLIHRDIKPENMLLGSNNEILISDFGIATMAQSSRYQLTQDVVGTVSYMAPEQIQGKPRPASDEYALGIVIYEWLTGSCPFQGSFTEIATQHVFASPPPLREKLPTVSADVEQVLFMALAKNPQQRFASLQAFAHAFEQAASQDPTWHSHAPTMLPLPPSAPTITPVFAQSELLATALPPVAGGTQISTPDPLFLAASEADRGPTRDTPTQNASLLQRRLTRRMLLGGFGAAAVLGGGAFAWFVVTQSPFAPSHAANIVKATATPVPTATPSPTVPPTATPSPTPKPRPTPNPTPVPTTPPEPTPQSQPTPQPTSPPVSPALLTYYGPANMYTVAWSPDGTWIASAGLGSNIAVWSAATKSVHFFCYSSSAKIYSVAWSPDGKYLVSGHSDGTVQVWDGSSGTHIFSLSGHTLNVNSVAWSPNGQYIASASGDKTVRIWDANIGTLLQTYHGHDYYVNTASWSQDSTYIASGGKAGTVHVWTALTGTRIYTYQGHASVVLATAWSIDNTRIASGGQDTTVQVWGATTGASYVTYHDHSDYVVALGWSPNGNYIASGSKDTTVRVWGATTGNAYHTYRGHSSEIEGLTWSPDGTKIASASDDGTVQVWSAL